MLIPHHTKLLFLILLLTSATLPLLMGGTPAQETQTDPPDDSSVEAPVAIFRPTGPDPNSQPTTRLVTAMDQARANFRLQLQELTASYHATPDLTQRRAIQRRIRVLKLGIETEILTIQIHHATEMGLNKEVDEIAARLAAMAGRAEENEPPLPVQATEGGGDHED
jgi:hypothetical protein